MKSLFKRAVYETLSLPLGCESQRRRQTNKTCRDYSCLPRRRNQHTGRAAKRLSETTGMEAKTIHRLLENQFERLLREFRRMAAVVLGEIVAEGWRSRGRLPRGPMDANEAFMSGAGECPRVGQRIVLSFAEACVLYRPEPATQGTGIRYAIGIFHRRSRRFQGTAFDKAATQRRTAGDQAVMRVRKRKHRQESNSPAAGPADSAPNRNPVMVFIMGLL